MSESCRNREEVLGRLAMAKLFGSSHEMLSALAKAIRPAERGWTKSECELLRADLIRLIGANHQQDAIAFADRVRDAAKEREDVTLFGVDYLAYPVDADGETIHLDDRVTDSDGDTWKVDCMTIACDGWTICNDVFAHFPDDGPLRRYHEPTVQEVLADMLRHFGAIEELTPEVREYIDEQAKRLRLAGDAK